MDPTVIAAVTGILGVILGAVIGGVFALKATKRQVEVMLLQSRGDVNSGRISTTTKI
jgi:transketolase N-terminal domain/subunit